MESYILAYSRLTRGRQLTALGSHQETLIITPMPKLPHCGALPEGGVVQRSDVFP